jgi:hypothetical protein
VSSECLANLLTSLLPYVVMVQICRRTWWLLFLLFLFISGFAHSCLIFASMTPTEFDDEKNAPKENTFGGYGNSFYNIWLGFINSGFDYLDPWVNHPLVPLCNIIFTLFTSIIIINLLSM